MSLERRRTGSGELRYVVRWRQGGKNRAKSFRQLRDARRWDSEVHRRKLMNELGLHEGARISVAELHEEWLATHGADLAPKTLAVSEGAWRRHVRPFLGDLPLVEVTPLALEKWARERIAAGAGEASVEKAWLLLSSMFKRAEAWGFVSKNPVRVATRPRKRAQKREPVLLDPADVEALRSQMDRRDATLVSVLAYSGLRPGEALALTWGDIGRTHISVTKGLSMGEVRETKTGKGRRVPVIPALRSDLLQWRMACGGAEADDPVFPNYKGEHWSEPDTGAWAGRRFKPALRAAGLDGTTRTYDLRHSHASMLIASGLNVIEVARRMGHSPTMCMDVYAHIFEDWEGQRIDLEDEIRKARDAVSGRASASAQNP